MTAAAPGDAAERRFARWCRWLLLSYPRHYRRRHGPEIVTTLLEMAPPGRRRPAPADVVHLIGSGLRQRFRLPAGRPFAVVAAVLVALTAGAFGAAAGSWAGARTFADLPDDAAVAALTQRAGGGAPDEPTRWRSPWRHDSVYADSEVVAWDAEQARRRLAADGWSVTGVTPLDGVGATVDTTGAEVRFPLHGAEFRARADGLIVSVRGHVGAPPGRPADSHGSVSVLAAAQRTPVFLPLVALGGVLGLIAGWMLAATVAYRIRRAPAPRRRVAVPLVTVAVLTLALPAVALYGNVLRAFRHHDATGGVMTVHSAFTPGPYYPFGPQWLMAALTVAGLAVAAAALVTARPGDPAGAPARGLPSSG